MPTCQANKKTLFIQMKTRRRHDWQITTTTKKSNGINSMPFWHLSISSNFFAVFILLFLFCRPELVFRPRLDLCSFKRREVLSDYSSTVVDAATAAAPADTAVTVWWADASRELFSLDLVNSALVATCRIYTTDVYKTSSCLSPKRIVHSNLWQIWFVQRACTR